MYNSYKIHTPNLDLPVGLLDVKAHLRLDDLSHADALIESYILGVAADLEKTYSLCLLRQTVKEYWSAFPESCDDPMVLRIGPMMEIIDIKYMNESGNETEWASSNWISGPYGQSSFVKPGLNKSYPTTMKHPNAITITYYAGFGTSPSSIPANIASAIKLQVAAMFNNPEDRPQTLINASEILLRPYYRFVA